MRGLLAGLLLLAGAGVAGAEPVVVYGLELEAGGGRERLLVFAREPVRYELHEHDARTLHLDLPGAALDPSAPSRLTPGVGGSVAGVAAFERGDVAEPVVRIVIERAPGRMPEISQRGALLAVDFAQPAPEETAGITMRFQEAELAEVVDAVARAAGETIVFDDTLRGTITIGVLDRVSVEEALAILDAALLMKGFALVPTPGGARAAVPIADAAAAAPWRPDEPGAERDVPITTLVRLRAARAEELVPALSLWIGSGTTAVAHPATNSVILAGSERRLQRLLTLVRALDEAAFEEVVVRRLRHRDAVETAEVVEQVHAPARIDAWPDARSNALIVRATPDEMEAVRETLERLDRPFAGGGEIRVIPVRYANPQALADLVLRVAGGRAAPVSGAAPQLVEPLLGNDFGLAVDAPTASLVATGDPLTLALLEELIDRLDRQPPRIRVEVIVLGIDADEDLDVAVDYFLPLADDDPTGREVFNILSNPRGGGLLQDISSGATDFLGRYAKEPLLVPIIGPGGVPVNVLFPRETVVVTAEGRRVDAHVLARPNLLVVSGEEQTLFVGDNVPVPVSSAAQGGSALQTSQNIERSDVGLRVRVTPTVGEQGRIRLELDVEQSRLRESLAGAVEEVGPTIAERRVTTVANMADGEYLVVGMSTESQLQRTETSTPFLRRIPILGALVSDRGSRRVRSHLVIAVRSAVARSGSEQLADSIRRRLAFQRSVARAEPAFAADDAPYALLVATTDSPVEAAELAARIGSPGRAARVSAWEWYGDPRYDVYLTGFATFADAADTALLLVEAGHAPDVVVDPKQLDVQPTL